MSRSKATFATSLRNGESICRITCWYHQYKAIEWKNWAVIFLPIYLKAHLPKEFYEMYMKFIRAIQLSCSTLLLPQEIDLVRNLLADFFSDYECIVYQYKYNRLSAMRPSIHQLLHIADSLKWAGPLRAY